MHKFQIFYPLNFIQILANYFKIVLKNTLILS